MERTAPQKNSTSNAEWRGFKFFDAACAVLLALCPILQHYQGLIGLVADKLLSDILPTHYVNLADNMTITLMALMAPYMAVRILTRLRKIDLKRFLLVTPLLAFFLFKVIDHGTSVAELLQVAISVGYILAVGLLCIDLKTFTKAATVIACIASGFMIVQYICYYIFGFHLQLVPDKLLLPSAEQWVGLVQTGRISITGSRTAFYRPASIFLEPSHFFMYSFSLLFINLYKNKKTVFNWIAGVLISTGIVLSTSGMGVLVVFGVWVLFAAIWDDKTDSLKLSCLGKLKHWIRAICVAVVFLFLFLNVPSINHSMARIIGRKTISISMFLPQSVVNPPETNEIGETLPPETNEIGETLPPETNEFGETTPMETEPEKPLISDKNAISGRVRGAIKILKGMNFTQWIIGCADSVAGADTNMPGFMSIAYKYGIIGLILSYFFFAYGLTRFDGDYFWATVIWFGVSFLSAHTHGMIYLLFYVMLFYNGFLETTGDWTEELKAFFGNIFRKKTTGQETEQ